MTRSTFVQLCHSSFRARIATCLLLVAVTDYVWYSHRAGWTAAVVNILLLGAVLLHNVNIAGTRASRLVLCAVVGLAVAPLWDISPLGLFLFGFLLVLLTILPRLARTGDAGRLALDVMRYSLRCFGSLGIVLRYARLPARYRTDKTRLAAKTIPWLVPVVLCGLFVALFAAANPLIDTMLGHIDWFAPFKGLRFSRLVFWMIAASVILRLVRCRYRQPKQDARRNFSAACRASLVGMLFEARPVLTSLIVFNLMFLVQNALDVRFLWSGAALPEGMTYAAYAHRGAYPLMVTALLAGWFVLTALKPGTEMERSPAIRCAVYAWLAQNIVLVASSLLRLNLYVAEYELTYMRVAAFIWMGLVAAGLGLIMARIMLGKSGTWLVNANALVLVVTLYVCSFVSFGGIIADYNVAHCRELTGTGSFLDRYYIVDLGDDALPAIARFEAIHPEPAASVLPEVSRNPLSYTRSLNHNLVDWHQWTLRRALLTRSLESPVMTDRQLSCKPDGKPCALY